MNTSGLRRMVLSSLVLVAALFALRLPAAEPPAGRLEKIRVHGAALDANLQGNDATRDVHVYLPASYASSRTRYPVIYFLHGYAVTADVYVTAVLNIPASLDKAMAGGAREAIVVMPDAFTRFGGSFYSNSPVIGDWEVFIAKDLVGYIDSHYRTIARRDGRGLAGHSMGGYGTLRIGMKHPEAFGAIYAMSSAANVLPPGAESVKKELTRMAEGIKTEARSFVNGVESQASAWAPNPQKPPYFFDLPFDAEGKPLAGIADKWTANSALLMLDQNVPALKRFSGIALDVGNEDGLMEGNRQLSDSLTRLGVKHDFEVYQGNHGNRVGARFIANVLPFFEQHLAAK